MRAMNTSLLTLIHNKVCNMKYELSLFELLLYIFEGTNTSFLLILDVVVSPGAEEHNSDHDSKSTVFMNKVKARAKKIRNSIKNIGHHTPHDGDLVDDKEIVEDHEDAPTTPSMFFSTFSLIIHYICSIPLCYIVGISKHKNKPG